jgi:hypothetical protein
MNASVAERLRHHPHKVGKGGSTPPARTMHDWLDILKKSLECSKSNFERDKALTDKWWSRQWRASYAIDLAALQEQVSLCLPHKSIWMT